MVDGILAPDGTTVTAWLEGFEEPLAANEVANGLYNLNIFQRGTVVVNGTIIGLKIGALDADQSAVWRSGMADRLDLTASSQ